MRAQSVPIAPIVSAEKSSSTPAPNKHVHDSGDSYCLSVGAAGFDRLEVSEQAYGSLTPKLVASLRAQNPRAWPEGNICMAALACGSGSQLKSLASLVGEAGRLVCSDISGDQLASASKVAADLGLKNVSFEILDINASPPPKTYDVVYARFVLVHLRDPVAALQNMWQMTKPGGTLLTEEHSIGGIGGEPYSGHIDAAYDLLANLGRARGVDFHLGDSIEEAFAAANVPCAGVVRHRVGYTDGAPKRLLSMSLREGAKNYIQADLISEEGMRRLVDQLDGYADQAGSQIFLGNFVQAWAKKDK